MYTVKYEEYTNDYMRKNCSKNFSSLKAIEDWIFDSMQQSYNCMWFPKERPSRIEFTPLRYGPNVWVYLISSERGIEFTDGRFTNGQTHWSNEVRDWLKHCNERKTAPKFTFAK
jgi:hypothetical protein